MREIFQKIKDKNLPHYRVMVQMSGSYSLKVLKIPTMLFNVLAVLLIITMTSSSLTAFTYINMKNTNEVLAATNDNNQEIIETYTNRFLALYQDVKVLSEQSVGLMTLEEKLRGLNEFDPTKSVLTTQNKLALERIDGKANFSASTVYNTIEVVDGLKENFLEQEITVNEMIELLSDKNDKLSAIPSIYPTNGYITSSYGYRIDPVYGGREFHTGIDIANSHGSSVYATADGVVTEARYGYNGFGYQVTINHGNGIETFYAHNSRLAVKVGDYVRKGEVIAYVGRTGKTTGPHVHYEVILFCQSTNPYSYLK